MGGGITGEESAVASVGVRVLGCRYVVGGDTGIGSDMASVGWSVGGSRKVVHGGELRIVESAMASDGRSVGGGKNVDVGGRRKRKKMARVIGSGWGSKRMMVDLFGTRIYNPMLRRGSMGCRQMVL